MNIRNVINGITDAAKEGTQNYINDETNYQVDLMVERQIKKDIKTAVKSYISLGCSDDKIFDLLSEFWNINFHPDAKAIIQDCRKSMQIIALRVFYEKQGMDVNDFRKFSREINLEEKLLEKSEYLTMPVEKLIKIISKW